MENKKVTQEELEQVRQYVQMNNDITFDFGQIKRMEIDLEERKNAVTKAMYDLIDKQREFFKIVEAKYGKGTVNIQDGTFVPVPEESDVQTRTLPSSSEVEAN